jgi:hypothetical protein
VNARKNVPSVEGAITRKGSNRCVAPGPQTIGVVDVGAPRQDRGDQRENLAARPSASDATTQADKPIHQRLETEAHHQCRRDDEPSIGHQDSDRRRSPRCGRWCAMMNSLKVPPVAGIVVA